MIYLLLPACNEEKAIGPLIQEAAAVLGRVSPSYSIVVIDDGSRDGTASAAKASLRAGTDALLTHERNYGLGRAMITGFLFLEDRLRPADIVVSMDADGTHLPGQIPRMVDEIHGGYDIVICSRFLRHATSKGVPLWRAWGSKGLNTMLRYLFRAPAVRDFSTNYRAYNEEASRLLIGHIESGELATPGFGFVAQSLILLCRSHLKVAEIPIALRYDRKQDASKMRVLATLGEYGKFILRDRRHRRW
jgi:dolichol-phosphate mannosyltransferase